MALLLLTGCVTVIVPTATPLPSPSPLTVTGSGKETGSKVFALAAGDYAVTYMSEPSGCFFNLAFANETYTYGVQLTPDTNDVPVPEPSLTDLPADDYLFVFNTQCDSWTTSIQQVR
jgi:hypothetical protein